jgi:hypothetical protein
MSNSYLLDFQINYVNTMHDFVVLCGHAFRAMNLSYVTIGHLVLRLIRERKHPWLNQVEKVLAREWFYTKYKHSLNCLQIT